MSERVTWVYFVSRDSAHGVLAAKCSLWWQRPERAMKNGFVTWYGPDPRERGYLGSYTPDEIRAWFRTAPDTDRELVHVEQYASPKMLEEARKQGAKT